MVGNVCFSPGAGVCNEGSEVEGVLEGEDGTRQTHRDDLHSCLWSKHPLPQHRFSVCRLGHIGDGLSIVACLSSGPALVGGHLQAPGDRLATRGSEWYKVAEHDGQVASHGQGT